MRTICASSVSRPTRSARMVTLPLTAIVAPMTRSPGALVHRHRLAGHHRLVDRRLPVDHDAVHRHLLARPDAQEIAGADLVERNVVLTAVPHPPRGFRRETEELPDRRAGSVARTKLEHLAEQHQHHDDDGGVEVGFDARRASERRSRAVDAL